MNNSICIADTNPQVLIAPIINVIEDTVSVEHVKALTSEVMATPITASAAVESKIKIKLHTQGDQEYLI